METVDDYLTKKKNGNSIKIDFDKAYDKVDWDYLDFVLHLKGFGERWR